MSARQTRLDRKFAALQSEGRKAFIAFVTAGDPDPERAARGRKDIGQQRLRLPAVRIERRLQKSDRTSESAAVSLSDLLAQ